MLRLSKSSGLVLAVLVLAGCQGGPEDLDALIPPEGKYDVRILRDEWGVPHIFGKRDVDAAYGLAFAHCEDDWTNFEDAGLLVRARLASVRGREWAKFDYIVQLFRAREFAEEKYESDLSPGVRAILEAYADGINHYAALNRAKMPHVQLPVTGKDLVAGATLKSPFFYGLEKHLDKLFAEGEGIKIDKEGVTAMLSNGCVFGSNAWAVAPSRSADGATRLAINSHQPWTGPVTWYEAHVHSEEGWNMVGGTFPAGPVIFKGHDENKGWCHTINRPDLADIYELEVNPANENQYKFDGEWRDFERATARIKVRLFGPISWTFKRELLWSVHGPAVRRAGGARAVSFAGYGEVRQIEQWFRMNKARNIEEFLTAMRIGGLASLNTLYADKEGNVFYVYNGMFPVRAEGYDWAGVVPGNTSETLWSEFYPFDKLPQVLNPPSGFVQTCNNSPFHTTAGEGNPNPGDFPAAMGIETGMTNRGLRALELYGSDGSITREEFHAYKYDKTYSAESGQMSRFERFLKDAEPDDPLLEEGLALLKGWDRTVTKDNTAAALAVLVFETGMGLREACETLMEHHGRLDVPWQEMMRLRRGDLDLGLGGGPDCLRALDVSLQEDGRFMGVNGDCYFLMAEWDKDGNVRSEAIHQFGAATVDEESPHYADQAPLFAEETMRPTLLSEEAVRAHLEREYRPGEISDPWYAK